MFAICSIDSFYCRILVVLVYINRVLFCVQQMMGEMADMLQDLPAGMQFLPLACCMQHCYHNSVCILYCSHNGDGVQGPLLGICSLLSTVKSLKSSSHISSSWASRLGTKGCHRVRCHTILLAADIREQTPP